MSPGMRVLLLGAEGQVGFELHRALAAVCDVVPATRSGQCAGAPCARFDLAEPESLEPILAETQPHYVVNAAAYTAVERAEQEPELAHRINAQAVGWLAERARALGACLVHFSTDYVFAGDAGRAYLETDAPSPLNVYGRSKCAGEHLIERSGACAIIFRTSWVYAARGHNFVRTMLRLAGERERVSVVSDQHGTPNAARVVAGAAAAVLLRHAAMDEARMRAACGLYHLSTRGNTTWHGLAQAVFARAASLGLLARVPQLVAISSAELPSAVRRPAYAPLDGQKLERTFGVQLPAWETGLDLTLAEMAEYRPQSPVT